MQEVEDLINLSTKLTGNQPQGTQTDNQEDLMESETKDPYSRPQTAMKREQMKNSLEKLRNKNFLNIPTENSAEAFPI